MNRLRVCLPDVADVQINFLLLIRSNDDPAENRAGLQRAGYPRLGR